MEDDNGIIQITEEDMEKAAKDLVVVSGLDLVGQTEPIEIPDKPGIQWTPPAYKPPSKEPVDIVLLIDTSGSMGANDYTPNRLEAAKKAAKMFTMRKVTQNYNDRVGVIGFGGSARVFHPLDSNLDKVAVSIDKLGITHSGTMIGGALRCAQQELKRYGSKRQAIVLLSDGGDEYDTSKPDQVAATLKGIRVFTVGMGTVKGGDAVLPHGRQKVYLNEKLLRKIATITGGKYLYAPDVPQLQKTYMELADY